MIAEVVREILRAVFGGGANISAANPLPVDTSPGAKTTATIIDLATLLAATTTTLAQCTAIDLSDGQATLALTVAAIYGAGTRGLRVHVRTSPTNSVTGTHPGAINLTVMTDPTAHFIVNELIGLTILNVTDGSSGVITANTINTVTVVALAGGATNQWNPNDVYSIAGADYDSEDWDVWDAAFTASVALRETEVYDTDSVYAKVLIENLDPAVAVTLLTVTASLGV